MNVMIGQMPYEIEVYSLLFFQMVFGSVFLFLWVFRKGGSVVKTSCLHLHLVRGVVAVFSMYCFYTSLKSLSSVDAVLLKSTTPFFVPLLSMLLIKEAIFPLTWLLIGVGFIGVYLVIGPLHETLTVAHGLALLGAIGFAFMIVSVNRLRKTQTPEQIVLYSNLTVLCCLFPFVLYQKIYFFYEMILVLVLLGLFFALAQVFLILAYSFSKPGRLSPFIFSEFIFTSLIMQLFFKAHLTPKALLGVCFIFFGAVAMFIRESRLKSMT